MLGEHDIFPATLPPGFSYVEGEPQFDPARHLALQKPEVVVTLAELGYSDDEIAHFPSPVAAAMPVRILSDEGVAALQQAIEATMPRTVRTARGDPRLYFGAYHSRFMRDLSYSPELTSFLSEVFEAPVAPHTMGHLGVQIVMGTQAEVEIEPWHHDRVSFTMVLTMYDPTKVEGGRFQYFVGTREEAKRILSEQPDLPPERTVSPMSSIGWAVLMQGPAVHHRGASLRSPGYRASFVVSFCHRDASYPDLNDNPSHFTDDTIERLGVDSTVDPSFKEWARHNAWLARARLGTFVEELPWTNDREFMVEQLRQAIAPIETAITKLERPILPRSEMRADQAEEDRRQVTTPVFDPARLPEKNGQRA